MEISEEELELKLKEAYNDGFKDGGEIVLSYNSLERLIKNLKTEPTSLKVLKEMLEYAKSLYQNHIKAAEKFYCDKHFIPIKPKYKEFIEIYRKLKKELKEAEAVPS